MTRSQDTDAFLEKAIAPSAMDEAKQQSSVVCTAERGNPVLYVSDAFEAHTGYAPAQAIGRNLSFLQGPATEPEAVAAFRDLISSGKAGRVRITNYRRDGTTFVHECDFRPVRDAKDQVTHFIAVQRLIG